MSDDNNDSFFKSGIDELSNSLKKEFSSNFDELKSELNNLKGSLNQEEKNEVDTVEDFVDHLNTCSNDNCEIHKAKNTFGNQQYMKGFLLGAKYGKAKKR